MTPDQKADRLLQLARTDFPDLSEAEEKMLRAAAGKGVKTVYKRVKDF